MRKILRIGTENRLGGRAPHAQAQHHAQYNHSTFIFIFSFIHVFIYVSLFIFHVSDTAADYKHQDNKTNPLLIVPETSPGPFETAVWNQPSIVLSILSFLGNPMAVCVMKRLNVFCNRVVVFVFRVLLYCYEDTNRPPHLIYFYSDTCS